MGRPYKITWSYQHDEEILESSIWYFDELSEDIEPADLTNVSSSIITEMANELDDKMPAGLINHGVSIYTPAIDGIGPARFINAENTVFNGDGDVEFCDSIVLNVQLSGENAAGEPVTGGMRLSVVPKGIVNRNQLTATWCDDMASSLNVVFPQAISTSGADWLRCIRHVKTGQDPEYVYPVTLTCSNRVGSNLTRVGNRPQRNAGPVETP
jgi:hypothetical protein